MTDKKEYPFNVNVYCQQRISDIASGRFAFDIPDYQRPYDWTDKNVERLFYDTLTSFSRLDGGTPTLNALNYTFLGSVILVHHDRGATNDKIEEYEVVDGQQRLTTLALVACSLRSELSRHKSTLAKAIVGNEEILEWLNEEISTLISELDKCALGSVTVGGKTSIFPKIIRSGSASQTDNLQSNYVTPIAKFLDEFAQYTEDENAQKLGKKFQPEKFQDESFAAKKLNINYKTINKIVRQINQCEWYSDRDFDQFQMPAIHEMKYQKLFKCLNSCFKDRAKIVSALSKLEAMTDLEHIIRILLFSSHFHSRILLTLIITEDEFAAFDIFDSLNTTGQPITALETLKPRVVLFENEQNGFNKSESESAYEKIKDNIDETTEATLTKQRISRELVTSFSVYIDGSKLGNNPSLQRMFLTTAYQAATKQGPTLARRFMTEIANLCEFKHHYFDCENSATQRAKFNSIKHMEKAKLLSSFITSMNTSMAIPLLFRYWKIKHRSIQGEDEFMEVLHAVTAFIVLRRAATGGTAGIDNDFRALMSLKDVPSAKLTSGNGAGSKLNRNTIGVTELKSGLVQLLETKFPSLDKKSWVERVVQTPLYTKSKPLVRFMMLVAADNALLSKNSAGTWTKPQVKNNKTSGNFLKHDIWIGEEYSTVEHIAPEKPKLSGWDTNLYDTEEIRHRLGNLILLPARENSSIGNQGWKEKKTFYEAAALMTEPEVDQYLDDAKSNGVSFPSKTEKILRKGNKLEILVPLTGVKKFDRKIVDARSENIADLCWKLLWPWLTKPGPH